MIVHFQDKGDAHYDSYKESLEKLMEIGLKIIIQ